MKLRPGQAKSERTHTEQIKYVSYIELTASRLNSKHQICYFILLWFFAEGLVQMFKDLFPTSSITVHHLFLTIHWNQTTSIISFINSVNIYVMYDDVSIAKSLSNLFLEQFLLSQRLTK